MKYFSEKAQKMSRYIQENHSHLLTVISDLRNSVNVICYRKEAAAATIVNYDVVNDRFVSGTCAETKDAVMYAASICE